MFVQSLLLRRWIVIPALILLQGILFAQQKPEPGKDYRIKLQAYTFDPLQKMPDIRPDLQLKARPGKERYRLIQFKHSPNRKQVEILKKQFGLKLDRYYPNYTYLEKISDTTLDSLKQLRFFRWSGEYQPAYKISPGIGQIEYRTEEGRSREGIVLQALLATESDTSAVKELLSSLGAFNINIIDDRKFNGPLRVQFNIPSTDLLNSIAQINNVLWIEEVAEIIEDNGNTAGTIQSGTPGTVPIWNRGIHGENQIVGVIDTPIDTAHCMFNDPVDNTIRAAHRKVVGYRNAAGAAIGTHGTFVAGIVAGDDLNNPGTGGNRGNAWAARLTYGYNQDVISGTASMLSYLSAAYADGAFIHTNSWHQEPATQYNQTAADVDNFIWNNEDNLVIGSSGNVGEAIGPPGTAKNAISVSATQQDPNELNFGDGNNGPTPDGRRKPDLFAPGCSITSAQAGTACTITLDQIIYGFGPICATSWATPAVAGAAAMVRQYYTEGWYPSGNRQPHHSFIPSGALLKATLLNSTIDMTGIAGYPGSTAGPGLTNQEGWGLILLDNTLYFPGDAENLFVWDVRNADGLMTGESNNYSVHVTTNTVPLKITLVWADPPASSGSAAPIVNDLDLSVISPDGVTTFLGNVFAAGQSTVGGTSDTLNNVEMVLVNTPQIGEYVIQINGTKVNVGDPGQGYALVVTADTEDPPVPTGDQNLLIVRAKFSDIAFEPPLPNLTNTINDAVNYFDEVAYGQVNIIPDYRGPITLDHPKSYYYHPSRNLLIELTEEVIAKLIAAEPDVFEGADPADPADDIDRLIIVTNDEDFTDDWATTGPWPYSLPGGLIRRISVSIQGYENSLARFTHGLAHQFGLVDLYAHPNVVFAQPHVDEWDNMAKPFTNSHFMAWSKERATWLTSHGSEIRYIPRPGDGVTFNETIPINFLTSTNPDRKAIAIGLTEGAADIEDEDVFYFVEARTNSAGGADDVLPEEGVLLYKVNENIPQGDGPVQIIDDVISTVSLSDAAMEEGDSQTRGEAGLTVTVQPTSATADRDIQISYDPPETDNDVNIQKGNPVWTSPDIWIDSQKDGFDLESGRVPMDRGDQPVTGEVNRIYYRVHNPGPGDAFNFTILIRVSEPYHTVGGTIDFNRNVREVLVESLGDDETLTDYVEWTPDNDGNPHSCIGVDIPNVFNDINTLNNTAQQNVQETTSSHSSPYEIVTYHFGFTNPEDRQELFYFRAENVPDSWTSALNPEKALLSANEHIECTLTIEPPETAPACTEHKISVTSWMPRGDTMIPIGGGTVQVDLRNRTDLELETGIQYCKKYDPPSHTVYRKQYDNCMVLTAQGCTNPVRANEEIIVRYEDPHGYPVYHTVVTDEYGCFSDTYVVAEGGAWEVTAEYPGNDCSGPAVSDNVLVAVPLPQSGDQDGDGIPDSDEPQGDHDLDGILGIFDTDSDNDGLDDGKELAGDCDRDGHDNIVDPDSDNDGIPDGQDSTPCGGEGAMRPSKLAYSFHIGSAHPLDNLNKLSDSNINVQIDFGYALRNTLHIKLMAGFNQFTAESSAGIDNPVWTNVSINLQGLIPAPSGLFAYLQTGPGYYWPKSASPEPGFNFGIGGQIHIAGPFRIEFGTDYHQVFTDETTRFITTQIGILFK
jgi:M6 family metalloprotease-like protein